MYIETFEGFGAGLIASTWPLKAQLMTRHINDYQRQGAGWQQMGKHPNPCNAGTYIPHLLFVRPVEDTAYISVLHVFVNRKVLCSKTEKFNWDYLFALHTYFVQDNSWRQQPRK